MRYSIMLQLTTGITLILLGAAALFAWIQSRPNPTPEKVFDETSAYSPQLFLKSSCLDLSV